jgi:hypothetical protein
MYGDQHFLAGQSIPSRRHYPRIESPQGAWVYWGSGGLEDTSRVRDLSLGGLCLVTRRTRPVGATIKLDFLVEQGTIRADAVVRYAKPGHGMGLRFTSVRSEDRSRLAELVNDLAGRSGSSKR